MTPGPKLFGLVRVYCTREGGGREEERKGEREGGGEG
jgi:hypothetical protein